MKIFNLASFFQNITTFNVLIALCDTLILLLSGIFLFYIHPGLEEKDLSQYLSIIVLTTIFTLLVFYFSKNYSIDVKFHYKQKNSNIILISTFVFLSLIMIIFALKVSDHYSRIWLFSWYFLSTFLICLNKTFFSSLLKQLHRKGKLRRNIVIIGGDELGTKMFDSLIESNEPWIDILAIYDDRVQRLQGHYQYPIEGNIEDLIRYARSNHIDEILIALPWHAEKRTLEILKRLQELPVHIRLCPDLVGFHFPNSGYSYYGGIPIMHLYDKPIDGWNFVFKSAEDRVFALLALILTLPIMVFIAILIKLDSNGPVFFRQKRYGFNNQLIEVLKFRTMHTDQQDKNAETLVTRNDSRVTKIGNILRRTSLDELPQLLNVLKGEMSMVGPRPHATKAKAAGRYYQDVVAEYAHRHKVKPGISGWAQVQGWRGETDTEEKIIKRVEHDLYYIENWSLSLDIYILAKTILVVFKTDNAY